MDKEKALTILFEAAKLANMSYQNHILVQQAYDFLKQDGTTKPDTKNNK